MKLLVLGGMHGDEPLGPQLVASLTRNPIPGVDALIANPRATKTRTRFINQDLNRSFPGDPAGPSYESRRAAELLKLAQGYDLILDFHNTLCPDNDCSFVGATASPLLYQASSYLKLTRVIIADYDCINKYLPNCVSIEISVTSPRMQLSDWRRRIAKLSTLSTLPAASSLNLYQYVYTITTAESDALNLAQRGLRVFKPMPSDLTANLNLKNPSYPIFLGHNYSKNVYAGVIANVDRPALL
jgi:hypothetical protein